MLPPTKQAEIDKRKIIHVDPIGFLWSVQRVRPTDEMSFVLMWKNQTVLGVSKN